MTCENCKIYIIMHALWYLCHPHTEAKSAEEDTNSQTDPGTSHLHRAQIRNEWTLHWKCIYNSWQELTDQSGYFHLWLIEHNHIINEQSSFEVRTNVRKHAWAHELFLSLVHGIHLCCLPIIRSKCQPPYCNHVCPCCYCYSLADSTVLLASLASVSCSSCHYCHA